MKKENKLKRTKTLLLRFDNLREGTGREEVEDTGEIGEKRWG